MRHHAIRGRISGLDLDVERVLSVRNAAGGGLPLLSAVFYVSDSPGSQKGLKFFLFLSFVSRTSFLVFPLFFSSSLCPPPRVFVSRPSVLFFSTLVPLVWVSRFLVSLLPSRGKYSATPFSSFSSRLGVAVPGAGLPPERAGLCFSTLSLGSPPFSGVRDLARRSLRRV